ncbi:MAG TPA: D-alanyl-D-alanine carboxypeptidase/D-alanyl-D-alanine-endopeptidase [Burkholderiales bacterium]|nr:D-alanyl-D-alanine carboxypeptidase/D-alanyl-D-alanine-endopeptidase [Burkholderiales bacterium]
MIRAALDRCKSYLAGGLLALTTFAGAADLPKSVLQALRSVGIPQSSVGAVVQEVGTARPSLAVNANQAMNPASVMKLVTTYAALELLGPAYRWKTEVYLDGDNLVLKGYGDPKLNYESFWMLLRSLRGRGVREIRGDVVLDRSHFAPIAEQPFDSEPFRPYNVRPDALLVNFKSLRFSFLPEEGKVRIFVEPALPGLEVVNSLKIVEGGCPEGRAFRDLIQASFESAPKPRAAFTGLYPAQCGERDLNVALYAPEDYVAGMIRQLWGEMGGTWSGTVRGGLVPPGARLVYVHDSEPLGEIVRDINKFSNNVMARQLFLTLGAELVGPPAQAENAARAIRQWLTFKNIAAPELVLENGSGLSRIERISPEHLAALLQAAWRSPVMPEFVASLPVVAADGTMKKRLRGERVAGNAHIKTGLLSDARAIAGYVLDRNGRRHLVVMIVNHPKAPEADAAMDALLEWTRNSPTVPARSTGSPRGVSPPGP